MTQPKVSDNLFEKIEQPKVSQNLVSFFDCLQPPPIQDEPVKDDKGKAR